MHAKTTEIRVRARQQPSVDAGEQVHIDAALERLWAETGLSKSSLASYRAALKAMAVFLSGRGTHLEGEHPFPAGGLVDCRLELVGIGLVREVLVRRR